jgi:hypothetical protein
VRRTFTSQLSNMLGTQLEGADAVRPYFGWDSAPFVSGFKNSRCKTRRERLDKISVIVE